MFLPAPEAVPLSTPSAWRWLLVVAIDWGVIALAMIAAYGGYLLAKSHHFSFWSEVLLVVIVVVSLFIIGTRQHGIAILGHEAGHGLISRHRWINDSLGDLLCLWPLGLGLSGYRKFHFVHHDNLATSKDPELPSRRAAAPDYDLPKPLSGIFDLFMGDNLLAHGAREEASVLFLIDGRDSIGDILGPIVLWGGFIYIIWLSGAWWIPALWFAALGSSFWAVFRLRIWTEHIGTTYAHRIHARLLYRLVFLPHNTWYHFEHHNWTSIPFWQLPKARSLDTETPVRSVGELFKSYAKSPPTPSGAVLKP